MNLRSGCGDKGGKVLWDVSTGRGHTYLAKVATDWPFLQVRECPGSELEAPKIEKTVMNPYEPDWNVSLSTREFVASPKIRNRQGDQFTCSYYGSSLCFRPCSSNNYNYLAQKAQVNGMVLSSEAMAKKACQCIHSPCYPSSFHRFIISALPCRHLSPPCV